MTRKQDSAKKRNWKELMSEQEDFLRPLIREILQEVLETENRRHEENAVDRAAVCP